MKRENKAVRLAGVESKTAGVESKTAGKSDNPLVVDDAYPGG